MKKVLALVLTLAMLVGSLAVGLSAVQVITKNEKVNAYWNIGSGQDYNPIATGDQGSNFDVEMDIRLLEADSSMGSWIAEGPYFSTSGVGVGDEKIAGTYNVGQWYHIKWDAEDGKTTIYVDGEQVGEVGKTAGLSDAGGVGMGTFWHFVKIDIDNLRVGTYFNDMEADKPAGNGQILTEEKILARYNLGVSYWNIGSGQDYNPIATGDQGSNFDVEMDIRLLEADSNISSWVAVGPYFSTSGVGVDDQKVGGPYNVNQWYHVKWEAVNGETKVYVDDVLVGKVGKTAGLSDAGGVGMGTFWHFVKIDIDNLRVGTYFNDMEADKPSGNGQILEHEMPQEKTLFDMFPTYDVEGEAVLVQACFNEAKNPSNDDNSLYTTTAHTANAVPKNYIINFDLAIYPDKEGNISSDKVMNGSWIEFIVNKFGSGDDSRVKIGNKFVGKNKDLYYYGEDDEVKDIQPWTPGEFHNVTLQINNGKVIVYIDKVEVYSAAIGMDNWDDLFIWYFHNCNAVIDNYRVYDAKTFEVKVDTFKINTSEEYAKKLSDVKAENFCEANGHHIMKWARTTEPKCYEMGENTYSCYGCDFAETKKEVAMLEHKFEHYDITRTEEGNEGFIVARCRTSAGCEEKKSIKLPAAEDYQGTLKFYHDFRDDFITVTSDVIGFEVIEDGVAKYITSDANYNQIGLGREYSSTELNGGIKVGFDFSVDGTFDTDASLGNYGHSFDIYIGGGVVGAATIKYNMDDQKFTIQATNNNFTSVTTKEAYPLVPGEVYNLEVAFAIDEDDMTGDLSVYLNGKKILSMNEDDAYDYLTYENSVNCLLMHVYGVKINVDNFVVGDYDFSWNRAYAGDVDGDYAITVNDALLMRKYLAKIIDMDDLYKSRADVNGDGYVDAIDQLRIRKALAE